MHRATEELRASGAADRALKAGDRAPDFTLKDAEGHEVSSREMLAQGALVVTFYRGVWCPYCNLDLQALQRPCPPSANVACSWSRFRHKHRPTVSRRNAITKSHPPILSDPGNEVAARFGLRFKLPDYLIALYRDTFRNDLSRINGDSSWTLPMPARHVVGTDGVIVYAEVNPDYTRRPDPSELLPVLSAIQNAAAA
jgi:peroxiredoxin